MEVRPGYKQTEAGVIPEEWDAKPLGQIAQLRNGYAFKSETYDPLGDFKVITIANVQDGYMDAVECNRIISPPSDLQSHQRLRVGDILISMTGNVGRVCRVTEPGCLLNQRVGRLLPTSVDASLLFSLLSQRRFVGSMATKAKGGAQGNLSVADITEFQFAVPRAHPEQRAIAAALSDVDALLDGLDRLIAKKRDLKQAAMQQLLTGQTRLPGFSGAWEVKRLGDIGEIRSGGTPSTTQPHFWDGEVPWCTPTDITALRGYKYLTTTARTISSAGLQASSAEVIPSRSLIMTSRATIGACAINLVPMTTNQGFKNVVPFAQFDVEFLYYLMTTQEASLVALCGGSTFLEIGKKQLSVYEISLPKARSEQTAIAAVLSDMDAELAALEARRDKTRDLKQAMMQELLTGRTRLINSKDKTEHSTEGRKP